MSSNPLLAIWSTGVWQTLGSPPNISALTISGYAVQPSTLGTLNSYLDTCFSGSGYAGPGTVNYDTVPDLTENELAITNELFLTSYYQGLAQATMGYGGDSIPWTNARDGDQSITRGSPAAIGANYLKAANDSRLRMDRLITAYINSNGTYSPRQVLLPGLVPATYSQAYWGNG